jgi:hypothetical protein
MKESLEKFRKINESIKNLTGKEKLLNQKEIEQLDEVKFESEKLINSINSLPKSSVKLNLKRLAKNNKSWWNDFAKTGVDIKQPTGKGFRKSKPKGKPKGSPKGRPKVRPKGSPKVTPVKKRKSVTFI